MATDLVARVESCRNVQFAFADYQPSCPDRFWDAAGGIELETVFGDVDLMHSPTRFVLPTRIRPIVATVHDIAPLSSPPFKTNYHAATLRALEFIRQEHVRLMTISAFTRHELETRAGVDVSDVVVVHPGVGEVFHQHRRADRPQPGRYILYVGGAGPNKNLERLLAAVRQLQNDHGPELVLAGDGNWDREDLRRAIGDEQPAWIRLSGYVTDDQLATLYRGAATTVVPSLHEGFGLPVLEALACGTPLACSEIPVFREVAGDAAVYFDPMNVNDMTATLASVTANRSSTAQRILRGQARAREFTWAETARKTVEVYRTVLQRACV